MSAFQITDFRGKIFTGALARSNRFEVIIVPPPALSTRNGRDLSLLVENVGFPNLSISAKAFKTWGPNHQMPVGSEYGGEGLPISFYLDGNMENKMFLEDWMEIAVDSDDYLLRYKSEYTTSIMISQLNDRNMPIYTIELFEAFPRSMSMIQLDNNATAQFARVSTVFAFRRWKRLDRQPSMKIERV